MYKNEGVIGLNQPNKGSVTFTKNLIKKKDEEIMRNSIHFRWIEIRRELRSRIEPTLIFS